MNARITILPGDGIGPEVTAEAVRTLRAVAGARGHDFELHEAPIGGAGLDAAGDPLPAGTLRLCREADAVFLGAVGGPKWDGVAPERRPERGLLRLRSELGVYANLRPVAAHPALASASPLRPERLEGVDLLIVRELTGGLYFGEKSREPHGGGERASDACVYTTAEIERIVRTAAALARERRGRLTSVDKANVLVTSRLWREVATRVVAEEFPDVELEHMLVDACAMHLLRRPADFDVIVTENMFGDILSDEASMLTGSLGLLPSASLGGAPGAGARRGLYEPVHGSAPDIAGRGIADPIGAILSAALLLRHSLGLEAEAAAVEAAVGAVLERGVRPADLAGPGAAAAETAAVGAAVAEAAAAKLAAAERVPAGAGAGRSA